MIHQGKKYLAGTGEEMTVQQSLAPRTYGDGLPGATTMIRGAYRLRGGVGDRLLDMLPPLHTDPARRWTVAELAAKTGMSRAAFAARFTSHVGEPPLTYLTGWRMTLAADLLHDTDDTIATIAREVGYQDAFAFSVAFKRAHSISPSTWRRVLDPDELKIENAYIPTPTS